VAYLGYDHDGQSATNLSPHVVRLGRCVNVGVIGMAARKASEGRLITPIASINIAAGRARLA